MFTGCGTALVTPFRRDLGLDEERLRALVRRQIENGINFLVPCGTTGESPTLSHDEHLRVVAIAIEEAKGKVPVLAGAGGYNTQKVIDLAREVMRLGAAIANGRERRALDVEAPRRDRQHCRREGSVRQHRPDGERCPSCARTVPGALR